jgi:hypothetical protein
MSALLVSLCLIGVAAIVWSACFVGCGFAPQAAPIESFYEYQNTVENTSGLVAFWPLNDTSGTVATDLGPNQFNGTYTTAADVLMYDPVQQSDAAPGTFTLNQPNIVAGDALSGDPSQLSPCVNFNGGFVSVPWQGALGPPTPAQFTLEAWVVPNWTLADAQNNPSFRSVVASAALTAGTFSGFALLATPDNLWAAAIGIGSQDVFATIGSNQTIVQGSLYFLVMTYDGTTLTLWVNPADTSQPPDASVAASGFVPVPSPVPLYIGTGRPDLSTPLFPFNGYIQDVAFYNVVLDNQTIATHYMNGSGMKMP